MEHLQETGIGKTVNALRKFEGEISVAAKALVTKWKAMVSTQDEDKEEEKGKETASAEPKEINITNINVDTKRNIKEFKKHGQIAEYTNHESSCSSSKHKNKHHHHSKERSKKHKSQESSRRHRHKSEGKERELNKVSNVKNEKECDANKMSEDHKNDREHIEHRKKKSKSHTENQLKTSHSSRSHQDRPKTQKIQTEPEYKAHQNDKSRSSQDHNNKTCTRIKCETSSNKRPNEIETNIEEASSSKKKVKLEQDEDEDEKAANVDGIDSSMGANFADVLGMLNNPSSSRKCKKTAASTAKVSYLNNSTNSEGPSSSSIKFSTSVDKKQKLPDLLASGNLEPLDPNIALELPTISNNYRPMPLNQTVMDCVFNKNTNIKTQSRTLTDAEALQHGISSKTMRTKIYSGNRTGTVHQVPSLFDLCIRMLQKNINGLEYTGGVPFDVLKNVLDRATPEQLYMFEEYNPYIMEDSDILWKAHVQRKYRTAKRQEMESWREMFLRCQEDEERKLNYLAEAIKLKEKKDAEPVRKTQLAFVDSLVKPPRNVARKQEQYGTRGKLIATPAARVTALSNVTPNAARPGDVRLRVAPSTSRDLAQVFHAPTRAKKAPLMIKTLQLMRGRNKR